MSKISFFSLGGMDENEKPCYVLDVDGQYYIFNLGITIPVYTKLGIKKIIPYIDWIANNAKSIKGIFIGNASHRNIGAIQYVYETIKDIPIYTSKLGAVILNSHFNKKSMQKYNNFENLNTIVLDPLKTYEIGNVKITPFRVVCSLAGSLGFVINTLDGNIVYLDEFIISGDKNHAFNSDITKINLITGNRTLLLINNVGNVAKNSGFTSPNHNTKTFYKNILMKKNDARVIVACHYHDIYTFITLASLAKEKQIPFVIYNPLFMNVFNTLITDRYFDNSRLLSLPIHKINEMTRGIIVMSSTPDRIFNKLISLTKNEDDILKLKKSDYVILGFKTISGFEKFEADIMDRFSKLDIDVNNLPRTILKMEASCEDHKFLINELRPRYVIPTLGMYYEMVKYENCLTEIGFNPKNCISLYNGEVFTLINGEEPNTKRNRLDVHDMFVGSQGLLTEGANILQERQLMSESGIIFYSIEYNSKDKCFNEKNVDFQDYGVVPKNEETDKIFKQISKETFDFASKTLKEMSKFDSKELKQLVKKYISRQVEKTLEKEPIVIVTIV